ncbi:ABC transporter ATP-binding protein [Achromobacter dolens]|uniref:ABC transporter ATP-binding protein n=1 Tax=Achromobacter dolens TaxID=1287738 RepID=UPI00300D1522
MAKIDNGAVALRCRGVSKKFSIDDKEASFFRLLIGAPASGREFTALSEVSLDVPTGRIVGILGRNGAGKSTLLRILGGVYQPTSGQISVDGSICGLFEMGGMGNRQLTGREYARRYFAIMGVPRERVQGLLDDIQDFSELGNNFDRRILSYSTGMAARLYFATATALQHDVYLIDELLSVGDEHFQAKCWLRMRNLLLNGASGILVTHDWVSTLRLCEQSHILKDGRIMMSGPSDQAVVKYLDLPTPPADAARFLDNESFEYQAISGQDTTLRFRIKLEKDVPVSFTYSIEMMRIGVGWEVLLLGERVHVASLRGEYVVDMEIDTFPLPAGNYSLNVSLLQTESVEDCDSKILDTRGWTTGNGFKLKVNGAESSGAVVLTMGVQEWDE